ncbi:MAG: 2,3-bisphosphoglycerate-independent phosphoglycerate mutase [Candidatus Woesearchaeota archaeon]
MTHKPIVVMIRDGWGYRQEESYNGPVHAETPYTDHLMETYPHVLIKASEDAVGLPQGFMGNSEVGHMTIGSGRIIYQAMVRIDKAIEEGTFFKNEAFLNAINHCKEKGTAFHIIGLLQEEGVHAHIDHCIALLRMCKENDLSNVLVHVISDGRDAPVMNTIIHVKRLLSVMQELGIGKIATISGRYYAMDRDKRWDRTQKAYDAIVHGKGMSQDEQKDDQQSKDQQNGYFDDPIACFEACYAHGETDEFIKPRCAREYTGIRENDAIAFFNFRSDRPRQLTKAIIEDEFEGWERKPLNVTYVCMTEYYKPMNGRAQIAYDTQSFKNLLGNVLADNGRTQLRISETEKYAHVTFFFNGQVETPNQGEERILIQSPRVATYDLQPEMSVDEIGDRLVQEIDKDIYDVIIVNFVNGDMVGHTGVWDAVVRACNAVDRNVKKVVDTVLEKDGVALVFADHGNCEEMEGKYKTSHTLNLVPFIVVSKDEKLQKQTVTLREGKGLQDVAPTVLQLLEIEKPSEMTGESIIE